MKIYRVCYLVPEVVDIEAEDVNSAIDAAVSLVGEWIEITDVSETTQGL